MSLARVIVEAQPADAGWTITVRVDGEPGSVVDPFSMEAVELPSSELPQRVPAVPSDRRPLIGDLVDALCAGDGEVAGALIDRLAKREQQEGDVSAYGRWLFECLLAPAWKEISDLPAVRANRGVEVALRWAHDDADLHRMVWEAMADGDVPLVGNPGLLVAVTRLVPTVLDPPPQTIDHLPRILFASGSTLDDSVARPGALFMGLLRAFESEARCVTTAVQQVSAHDLADVCARFRPDVVHLVAHGAFRDGGRTVVTLGPGPNPEEADATALSNALAAGGRPTVAVLSACQTGTGGGPTGTAPLAAELIHFGGIPIVSAMVGEVSEQACRLYSKKFVEAIHNGDSVVSASASGRRAALWNEQQTTSLDWAMPALFLADTLAPDFQVIDPAPALAFTALARGLELREPQAAIFIGREDILRQADTKILPTTGPSTGLVAIVADNIADLGGTRLLREIGLRLLRQGHLPLLLGPYGREFPGGGPPQSLRTVVREMLGRAVLALERMAVPPPPLRLLETPEGADRIELGDALAAFKKVKRDLEPDTTRTRLGEDLKALAARASQADPPFGEHTRVVVLADEVHNWGEALQRLLEILKTNGDSGLGTPECPAPLVATASLGSSAGVMLRSFIDQNSAVGFLTPPLRPLDANEATLGFEWVLLHPWREDDEHKGVVYARGRTSPEASSEDFEELDGKPTAVDDTLYLVARMLVKYKEFVVGNDEKAWRSYVARVG